MNILFSIGSLEGGGAEKVLVGLANELCQHHQVTVQTIYNEGLYRDQLDPRVHYRSIIKKPSLNKKRVLHRLITWLPAFISYRLWVGGKYDVAIAFLEGLSSKLISGAGDDTKNVSWIHTNIKPIKPRHAGFTSHRDQARAYARFDRVVCVSGDVAKAFVETVQPTQQPLVIYNPIKGEEIQKKATLPASLPQKESFVFCSLGRLVPVKAFDRILHALSRLKLEGLDASLWLLGEGEEKQALTSLVAELGVLDRVVFAGFQQNPYPFVAACDAYVCSSLHEGYPLSVAEALVLSRPVVATLCTGNREILGDGAYGLLVDNSDEGIYQGMKAVLDKQQLEDLQAKARVGSASFDYHLAMGKVHDLLEGLEE